MSPANPRKNTTSFLLTFALIFAGMLFLMIPSGLAADSTWTGGDGSWSDSKWNPLPPVDGDNVFLTSNGSVFLDESTPELDWLFIGNGMTLNQNAAEDTTSNFESIGDSSVGTHNQNNGTNTVKTDLNLGQTSTGSGNYTFGGGNFSAGRNENIGINGQGTFRQNGGNNVVTEGLILGTNNGASGSYTLSGGDVSSRWLHAGVSGTGEFIQNTGDAASSNSTDTLILGLNADGYGTYTLTAGTLTANASETVGYAGSGSLTQSGGTNTVTGGLTLGLEAGSTGNYNLSGYANLTVYDQVTVGSNGTGVFTQDGGTFDNTNNAMYLGDQANGNGTYYMKDGSLNAGGIGIGEWGGTGNFIQTGGTVNVLSGIGIARQDYPQRSTGTYSMEGGTLNAGDIAVGQKGDGTYAQSGGIVTVGSVVTHPVDAVDQSDNEIYWGDDPANGVVTLKKDKLNGGGVAIGTDNATGGVGGGTGNVVQSGGIFNILGELYLATSSNATGNYELSGNGILTTGSEIFHSQEIAFDADGNPIRFMNGDPVILNLEDSTGSQLIGLEGAGTFTQSGGTNTVGNELILGVNSTATASGTYLLTGGNLNVSGTVLTQEEVAKDGDTVITDISGEPIVLQQQELSGGNLIAGNNNVGTFSQSGDSVNNVGGNLVLGQENGVTGTYNLGGTASLNATGTTITRSEIAWDGDGNPFINNFNEVSGGAEYIGEHGTGAFTQSGGTNTANRLILGQFSGSEGTYTLSGDPNEVKLTVNQSEAIGGDTWGLAGGKGTFNQNGGSHSVGQDLVVGWTGEGTFNLNGGNLYTGWRELIGSGNTGTFTQSGGSNAIGWRLEVGEWADGLGIYNLSAGSLTVGTEYIGHRATGTVDVDGNLTKAGGTFVQTGGTNTTNSLIIGKQAGSTGQYDLGGSGNLTVNGTEIIGDAGTGTLVQNGGTASVTNDLILGNQDGSYGYYDLFNGTLTVQGNESIGKAGYGVFSQYGTSINEVYGNLYVDVALASSGIYNLENGTLKVHQDESLGNESGAYGTVYQNNGSATIDNNLAVGLASGAQGTYNLNGGTLSVGGTESIGVAGTGTMIQDNGAMTHSVTGDLNVGETSTGNGSFELKSGTLTVGGIERIGWTGTGTFSQTGGSNTLTTGNLYLGGDTGSNGTYSMSDAAVSLSVAGYEYIGDNGTGTFNQYSGTHTIGNDLYFGLNSNGNGTYNLDGGNLSVTKKEIIGSASTGTFNQNGGSHNVGTNLYLGWASSSAGTYNLNDGTLTAGKVVINPTGTFNFTGGNLNANVTNNNDFNLSGTGTRTVNGNVINNGSGTIKITDTTANFTGTLTNYGAIISDPSVTTFTDLVIGSTGYLVGGAGDEFLISGNFENYSSQTGLWDTSNALLGFIGTGAHQYTLNSVSSGFNWGTLYLAPGTDLLILGDTLGTLHFDTIILGGGSDQYNSLAGHLGTSYNITYGTILGPGGSGDVLGSNGQINQNRDPISSTAIPEPSTLLFLGTGLIGWAISKKRKQR